MKYLIYYEDKYHSQHLVGSLEACTRAGALGKIDQRYGTTEGYSIIETNKYDKTPETVTPRSLRTIEMRY